MIPLLVVNHLPERSLGANTREHFHAKGRTTAEERLAFGIEASALLRDGIWREYTHPVHLRWVLYVATLRGDWDNWVTSLKPMQDALVDIGMLPGDGPRWVRGGTVEIIKDKAKAPRTELYVEEVS